MTFLIPLLPASPRTLASRTFPLPLRKDRTMAFKPLKPSKRSRHERKAELKRAMQPPPKVFPQPEPAAPVFKPLG